MKSVNEIVAWRWTPFFALVGGTLLVILIIVLLIPTELGNVQSPKPQGLFVNEPVQGSATFDQRSSLTTSLDRAAPSHTSESLAQPSTLDTNPVLPAQPSLPTPPTQNFIPTPMPPPPPPPPEPPPPPPEPPAAAVTAVVAAPPAPELATPPADAGIQPAPVDPTGAADAAAAPPVRRRRLGPFRGIFQGPR